MYQGFRKIDPEQWEFANDEFIRGQPHRLKNIHRRKPIYSHSVHNQVHGISSPLSESERVGYQDDIGRLKRETEGLRLELERKVMEREQYELHAQSLKRQVECIGERQEKLVSFLAQILNKPGLVLSSTTALTTRNKKRRLLITDCLQKEAENAGNQLRASELGTEDTVLPSLNNEAVDLMECSITHWEKIICQVGRSCGEDIYDLAIPLAVILTEIDLPLEDAVINPENHISPGKESMDNSSTFELGESQGCADSPTLSFLQLNVNVPLKDSGIDLDHECIVQVPEVVQLSDKASAVAAETRTTTIKPTGANDTFWAQFLTEHPGSSNAHEAHNEKNEPELNKQNESSKLWWNVPAVNNLVEQMGHLTPAERT